MAAYEQARRTRAADTAALDSRTYREAANRTNRRERKKKRSTGIVFGVWRYHSGRSVPYTHSLRIAAS
jgi:hypothetical protein